VKPWKRTRYHEKIRAVLSVFRKGEHLTAGEIIERLREKGYDGISPQGLGTWLRTNMWHKHLGIVHITDEYGKQRRAWYLL